VVITAPRRYGKSSLIEQAICELAGTRPKPAIVRAKLLQAGSLHSAAGVLVRALYKVPGGAWQGVKETAAAFVRRLRVSPTVTFDPAGQTSSVRTSRRTSRPWRTPIAACRWSSPGPSST